MQLDKNNLRHRFLSAFSLHDQIARLEAIGELLDLIDSGEGNLEDVIQELSIGIKQENDLRVLSYIWLRLASMKPNNDLKAFAERELDSPTSHHRRFALQYLASAYPEDRKRLCDKMIKDTNPVVLFEVGEILVSFDPDTAVNLWFSLISVSPHVLGDEIIPYYIGQYADNEFINYLKRILAENPNDEIAQMIMPHIESWNMVDYLDASEPVGVGSGYWIKCPNCMTSFAVRDGHAGERGRCHQCQVEFIIPEKTES